MVAPDELGVVEHEVAVVAPLGEQAGAEAGALDPLQPVRRDDLVGVDVGAVERHGAPGDDDDGLPSVEVLRRGERPGHGGGGGDGRRDQVGAAAPTLAPLEVAVRGRRAPLARRPACRGSWPGTWSSPARAIRSRRRVKTLSSPSASAWALTRCEPGTTSARSPGAHRAGPRARRPRPGGPRSASSCSYPRNTVSTVISRIGVPAVSPM